MKKALLIAAATAMFLAASAPAVFAADGYGTPGTGVALSNTRCAGAGAFGALGRDYNMAGGASGYLTGYNNSNLCGNPQGNP
ncbi:MAG: hypothetical protein M0Z66_10680 [Thermaerobacter sp.]|nr:hypothetical protein [Thermaerobacter sp.]